ncbi:MAG TPA: hypothetical protein VFZ31_07295 [Vicinamibacterales bacterium]
MKRIKWSAVFVGLLVDIGGTFFLGISLVVAQGIVGVTILDAMSQDPRQLLFQFSFGLALTIFGGFVAGLVAQRDFALHGAAVGALTVVMSVISLPGSTTPPWYDAASALSVIPAGAFGGFLATFMNWTDQRRQEPR